MSIFALAAIVCALVALLMGLDLGASRRPRTPLVTSIRIRFLGAKLMDVFVGTPQPLQVVAYAAGVPVDLAKFPGALTGIVWSSSDAGVASVTASPTGLTAMLVPVADGTCKITATGKNKDGADVTKIVDIVVATPVPLVDSIDVVPA